MSDEKLPEAPKEEPKQEEEWVDPPPLTGAEKLYISYQRDLDRRARKPFRY